jgi:hypothetical protein
MTLLTGDDWFYVDQRNENEIPVGTRVESIEHNHNKLYHYGKQGVVVGHRYARHAIYPQGWNYIRFDDDEKEYSDKSLMPYAHSDYLKVIK